MSSSIGNLLIERCLERSEPCVPEVEGESWFSIQFVSDVVGYESVEYFTRLINERQVPRHPFQNKCIRFSDLTKHHVKPAKDT